LIFGTKCENNIDRIKEIITEVLAEDHRMLKEPVPEIGVLEWGTKGMRFVVSPWVKTKDDWAVYFETQESMKKRFDQAGVAIPELSQP
jgi:small conductance mechanosensitive channel